MFKLLSVPIFEAIFIWILIEKYLIEIAINFWARFIDTIHWMVFALEGPPKMLQNFISTAISRYLSANSMIN